MPITADQIAEKLKGEVIGDGSTVLTGFAPIRRIDTMGRRPYLLAFAYLGYLIAITIWNVPFLLLIVAALL